MELPGKSDENRLNRAYRCFGFLGLATLPVGLASLLDALGLMNFDMGTIGEDVNGAGSILTRWAFVVAMFLGVPILVGMLTATVYGIRQTVRFRHRPLVILSAVSVVCWAGTMIFIPFMDLPGHEVFYHVMDYVLAIALGVYTAANVLIPAWWFTKGRRAHRSELFAQE
jgi:hypothetical protein